MIERCLVGCVVMLTPLIKERTQEVGESTEGCMIQLTGLPDQPRHVRVALQALLTFKHQAALAHARLAVNGDDTRMSSLENRLEGFIKLHQHIFTSNQWRRVETFLEGTVVLPDDLKYANGLRFALNLKWGKTLEREAFEFIAQHGFANQNRPRPCKLHQACREIHLVSECAVGAAGRTAVCPRSHNPPADTDLYRVEKVKLHGLVTNIEGGA